MASLLYEDCRRLGLLPSSPIVAAYLDGCRGGSDTLELELPGLLSAVSTSAPGGGADCLVLGGLPAQGLTVDDVDHLLATAGPASCCAIDVPVPADAGPQALLLRLRELGRSAARAGFRVTDLRASNHQATSQQGRHLPRSYRIFLERSEPGTVLVPEQRVRRALVLDACGLKSRARSLLAPLASAGGGYAQLVEGAYLRDAQIDGLGPAHPVAAFARANTGSRQDVGWRRSEFPFLVSIHIQTNSPDNFTTFCDRIANSCDDPSRIEVIVKIDDDHVALNELLPREVERQPFQLKFISTPLVGGFFALWESMNDMLAITDPGAYFLLNLNDEMYFSRRGWDTRLERYVGLYPDHLYRLRTSVYKTRNYFDHWECGFAPETSAVTTKRWIETGGNWNPCLGPDTFQQCVAYYFNLINRRLPKPRYREIPIEDIEFGGEGAYLGLTGKALRRRVRGATRAWFRLMSAEIQEEAARRAAKLHAAISAHEHGLGMEAVHVNKVARTVAVVDPTSTRALATHSFAIPKTLYYRLNVRRALQYEWFGGGGVDVRRPPVRAFLGFMAFRYDWAEKIREWIYEEPPIAIGQKLQPLTKARLAVARFIRDYVLHAPGFAQLYYLRSKNWVRGHISLFYHRVIRRGLNFARLLLRRSVGYTKWGAWIVLVGIPRRLRGRASLFWHREVRHGINLLELAARRAIGYVKWAAWTVLVGIPRRLTGRVSLFWHRDIKHGTGLAELAARRAWGHSKVAAWHVLVGFPRRMWGRASLFWHRDMRHGIGLAELAARRAWGYFKLTIWHILIGFPRRVRRRGIGLLNLGARRSVSHARVASWRVLVGFPRQVRGLVKLHLYQKSRHGIGFLNLAARRSVGHARVAIWRLLVGFPRLLRRRADLLPPEGR